MFRCKRLYLYLLAITLSTAAFAQTAVIDSLKAVIILQKSKTDLLASMLALCNQKESLPADTIFSYAIRAKKLATELSDKKKIYLSDYFLILCKVTKGDVISTLDECSRYLKEISYEWDKDLYIKFSLQKSRIYIKRADYKEALATLYFFLNVAEKHQDIVSVIYAHTSIGWVNMEMGQLHTAMNWLYKAAEEVDQYKPDLDYSPLYSNMAAILNDLGKPDSATYYVNKSIAYSTAHEHLSYLANALAIQADIFINQKNMKGADASLNRALNIRRQIGDPFYIVSDMGALAYFYATDNKPEQGIPLSLHGIDIARQYGFTTKELYLYDGLAENYKAAGNYKLYGETLKTIGGIKDSLYKKNSAQALAELQAKYETGKQQTTIIEQKYNLVRKNYLIYGTAGLLLATIIVSFFALRAHKHKERLQLIEITAENEKANLLGMEKAKEEERKRIIADLHDDLGSGLSSIRILSDLMTSPQYEFDKLPRYGAKISDIATELSQRMNTIVWALNVENDSLSNLCEYIKQYGYSFFEASGVQFHIAMPADFCDEELELSGVQRKNVFLCVKESLNNIVRHADAQNAWVEISLENCTLRVVIRDDGRKLITQNRFGNGLKNMLKRMNEINGEVDIKQDSGMVVTLQIEMHQ